jgi:anti-anti-sigma factor
VGDLVADSIEVPFQYEIESAEEDGVKVTTVLCHGRLTNQTGDRLRNAVKPIIPQGGKIFIDLTDVNFMDSMGLGTLVGLKVSAVNEGYCTLTLVNLTPRLQELLRITNLTNLFSS